jgi:hypothetical protein
MILPMSSGEARCATVSAISLSSRQRVCTITHKYGEFPNKKPLTIIHHSHLNQTAPPKGRRYPTVGPAGRRPRSPRSIRCTVTRLTPAARASSCCVPFGLLRRAARPTAAAPWFRALPSTGCRRDPQHATPSHSSTRPGFRPRPESLCPRAPRNGATNAVFRGTKPTGAASLKPGPAVFPPDHAREHLMGTFARFP